MSIGFVALVAWHLVTLHAPDGNDVAVNPGEVVSLRGPRAEDTSGHFTEGAHCLINTSDGRYVTVRETCAEVMRAFVDAEKEP